MMRRLSTMIVLPALCVFLAGCETTFGPRARNGITFYCPGAGNVDLGDAGLREGLQRAGYKGEVSRVTWTFSFNPAIDQAVRINARIGAAGLATAIQAYIDEYPGREVNVVGLSAGTGVAVWALENLEPKYKVNNVILLGSSLSYDYDLTKALRGVKGKIYCYYSGNDAVLAGPMKIFGTIDGKLLTEGAGSVGFLSRSNGDRVVNIRWRPEFANYGYAGGHMDSTSPGFVRKYLAKYIVKDGPTEPREKEPAKRVAKAPPLAPLP